MRAPTALFRVNLALAAFAVAVLLGCGGDLATPPAGSTEEKLNGTWVADPLPGEGEIKHTARELAFTFVESGGEGGRPGFIVDYREWQVRKGAAEPTPTTPPSLHEQIRPVKVSGLTATADPPEFDADSRWSFRLEPDKSGTLYGTWARKDGTKRLDEVEFRRKP